MPHLIILGCSVTVQVIGLTVIALAYCRPWNRSASYAPSTSTSPSSR